MSRSSRRACCEKVGLRKGPWRPEEDKKLIAHVEQHGYGNWRSLPARAGSTITYTYIYIYIYTLLLYLLTINHSSKFYDYRLIYKPARN